MFFLRFIRYLRGYVWFEASGARVERFLNLLARARIAVWNGRKRGDLYTGCIAAGDYRKLRVHARKTGVRLRVADKQGVPFQRRRFRKRQGLWIGLAVFLLFVFGMSRFVWRIEITGNEAVSNITILQALEALEIEPGVWSAGIDIRDCERKILLLVPSLSWAAFNLDGSALRVEVSERVPPPEIVDPAAPCNIVAGEAGQIVAMNVYDGEPLVGVGDTVLPGDIIVSGIMQDSLEQNLIRHARAQVFAETVQELEVLVPLKQMRYTETGGTVRRRYLELLGLDVPLFLPLKLEFPYHVNRETHELRIFSYELPVRFLREEYVLMEENTVVLSEAEAMDEALRMLANLEAVRLDGAEVLDRGMTGQMGAEGFRLHARILCKMNIAREQEILMGGAIQPEAVPGETQ